MKAIFLDFDGVLHPSPEVLQHRLSTLALQGSESILATGLFRWASLLEDALQAATDSTSQADSDIAIIAHSSWRNQPWMTTDLARGLLGPLGHRFAGFTTRFEGRERSIEDFVSRASVQEFLILDDAEREFSALRDHLVLTNPLIGLNDSNTLSLVSRWVASKCRPAHAPAEAH